MTPKEARSQIRFHIRELKDEQIEAKKILAQPHGPDAGYTMGQANNRAMALSLYHNALNELCGRKPSHNYKVPSWQLSCRGENTVIKEIKAQIVWPEAKKVDSV